MDFVTITLPIIYKATGIARGKRKPQDVYFVREDETVLPSISADEAPLAIEYKTSALTDPSLDGFVRIRFYDDRLYRQSLEDAGQRSYQPIPIGTIIDRLAGYQAYNNPLLDFAPSHRYDNYIRQEPDIRRFDPNEWREIQASHERTTVENAFANASRYLVIDGELWEETAEPIYDVHVRRSFLGDDRPGDYEFIYNLIRPSRPTSEETDEDRLFRLDQFEEASDFCRKKYGRPIDPSLKATVLMPEVLKQDSDIPALITSLKSALDASWNSVAHAPIDTMIAWAEFRDAWREAIKSDPAEERLIDDAIQKAQRYAALPDASESARSHIETAIERWSDRTLTFSSTMLGS